MREALSISEILDAEATLGKISDNMAWEYRKAGDKWPRGWMMKHTKDRATIIQARNILLEICGRVISLTEF